MFAKFHLYRSEDESGVSGVGVVAYGCVFPSGVVVLNWRGEEGSVSVWPSMESMIKIHGHQGKTVVQWL
jgi:hypothetical protein